MLLPFAVALAAGCSGTDEVADDIAGDGSTLPGETGPTDVAPRDSAPGDSSGADTNVDDVGASDTSVGDAGATDTKSTDTGATDTGATDTGATDTGATTGDLKTSSAKRVNLLGGARAKNIVWQVAGLVDFGTTSHFEGVVLCKTGIALRTGASINGRLLAQTAITIESSTITQP